MAQSLSVSAALSRTIAARRAALYHFSMRGIPPSSSFGRKFPTTASSCIPRMFPIVSERSFILAMGAIALLFPSVVVIVFPPFFCGAMRIPLTNPSISIVDISFISSIFLSGSCHSFISLLSSRACSSFRFQILPTLGNIPTTFFPRSSFPAVLRAPSVGRWGFRVWLNILLLSFSAHCFSHLFVGTSDIGVFPAFCFLAQCDSVFRRWSLRDEVHRSVSFHGFPSSVSLRSPSGQSSSF